MVKYFVSARVRKRRKRRRKRRKREEGGLREIMMKGHVIF